MSPPLKRVTEWLCRPVIKVLACPAYSTMPKHVRMSRAPNSDAAEFTLNDNPAEGAHRRRQATGNQEPLGTAIVTSGQSDDSDWQRWVSVKRGEEQLSHRSKDGTQA